MQEVEMLQRFLLVAEFATVSCWWKMSGDKRRNFRRQSWAMFDFQVRGQIWNKVEGLKTARTLHTVVNLDIH